MAYPGHFPYLLKFKFSDDNWFNEQLCFVHSQEELDLACFNFLREAAYTLKKRVKQHEEYYKQQLLKGKPEISKKKSEVIKDSSIRHSIQSAWRHYESALKYKEHPQYVGYQNLLNLISKGFHPTCSISIMKVLLENNQKSFMWIETIQTCEHLLLKPL